MRLLINIFGNNSPDQKEKAATIKYSKMKLQPSFFLLGALVILISTGCNNSSNSQTEGGKTQVNQNFMEGTDYTIFDRVRIMDKQGFTEPAEAYSLLLPKGWAQESEIIWISPGQTCAGNNAWLKAASADKKYSLEFLPNKILSWMSNQETL